MSRIILFGSSTILKELINLNRSLEDLFLKFISLNEYRSRLLIMITIPRLEQLLAGLITLIDNSNFFMKLFKLSFAICMIEFVQILIKSLYSSGLNKMNIKTAFQI